MRLRVTRRGGIAGLPLVAEVDTADLGACAEEAVRRVLDEHAGAARPAHPDGFTYHLTVLGDDAGRSAELPEHAMPEALRPLIEAVRHRGRVARGD